MLVSGIDSSPMTIFEKSEKIDKYMSFWAKHDSLVDRYTLVDPLQTRR